LNEIANLPRLIHELKAFGATQTIIVDGGSDDGSLEQLRELEGPFEVISSDKGRAQQLNAGAVLAHCEILLFLHADTKLPIDAKQEIQRAPYWGRFDVAFDSGSKTMGVIAYCMNVRSRLSGVATGDQAIFVRRSLFELVGGFPEIPLMEDVAISKLLKRQHRPYCSRQRVLTSARRWQENGVLSTVVRMWWYRLAYFLGVSPIKMKQGYQDVR